jgi:hypothetical protein
MNFAEPTTFAAALAAALWIGLLTAISPCPIGTDLGEIGYMARYGQGRGCGPTWLPVLFYSVGVWICCT